MVAAPRPATDRRDPPAQPVVRDARCPGLLARGEPGGADARAYWAAVRIWLNGGDAYHPTGPFLPYVYAPWMLPLFTPWAALPWDVAWFVWRGGTILLLLWTIHWAYRQRPLTTAVIFALLAFPFGANLDTGNINLQLTLMLWAAQFTGPRLGGLLWALATWMKWIPAVHWLILPGADAALGPLLAGGLDRAQHRDAAADDHPAPGAVRVRGAPGPPRLPRLPVGVRPVALPPADPFDFLRPATWRALGRDARTRVVGRAGAGLDAGSVAGSRPPARPRAGARRPAAGAAPRARNSTTPTAKAVRGPSPCPIRRRSR